jgi:hypothetical protein
MGHWFVVEGTRERIYRTPVNHRQSIVFSLWFNCQYYSPTTALVSSVLTMPSGLFTGNFATVLGSTQRELNPKRYTNLETGRAMTVGPAMVEHNVQLLAELSFARGVQARHDDEPSSAASFDSAQDRMVFELSIETFYDVISVQDLSLNPDSSMRLHIFPSWSCTYTEAMASSSG